MQDLTNKRFGRLTVIRLYGRVEVPGFLGHRARKRVIWLCRCDCGNLKTVRDSNLKSENTRSCGCLYHRHHQSRTPTHKSWTSMVKRCRNPTPQYYDIKVCHRWRCSFLNFLDDMGERPGPEYTLDRIDNDKGYYPGNCRWATAKEQARNRRTNHLITYRGKTLPIAVWADHVGLKGKCLRSRINRGWPIEKALNIPKYKHLRSWG
jgi:hypothetical protein